jgi:hypothetical protein
MVRAEAAIALAGTSLNAKVASVLWRSIGAQAEIHENATGWYRQLASLPRENWAI